MRLLAIATVICLSLAGCFSGLTGPEPEDYLTDDYTRWRIEIDASEGERPASSVTNLLRTRLDSVVHKESIVIDLDDTLPSQSRWTRGDLDDLHDKYQDQKTGGSTVVTHVLYLDGEYQDPDVLGVAVGHEFIAIFSGRITSACNSNILCGGSDETRVQQAVLIHEFGHILGLVGNGVPTQSNHGDGSGHSTNRGSVMYPSAETTGIFGLSTIPTDFDSADRQDLACAGGKGSC